MHVYTRRNANFAIAAAGISIFIPRSARAAAIEMRQVHNQPVDSPLHRRLTQELADRPASLRPPRDVVLDDGCLSQRRGPRRG